MNMINLKGKRFGRLRVIQLVRSSEWKRPKWECVYDCGETSFVRSCHLLSGHNRSCGCFNTDMIVKACTTHGQSCYGKVTPEYRAWQNAKKRVSDRKSASWKHYGGRGITMCKRWFNSFEHFISDIGKRPTRGHSVDRINNDGNYEPSNCRWATRSQQQKNKRRRV